MKYICSDFNLRPFIYATNHKIKAIIFLNSCLFIDDWQVDTSISIQ